MSSSSPASLWVAVAGLPSWEMVLTPSVDGRVSRAPGVGKSSFCSRFVRPAHDDNALTREQHRTDLTREEFDQIAAMLSVPTVLHSPDTTRPHCLYFGSVSKRFAREHTRFHLVEYTTFYSSEHGIHHNGQIEPYVNRATVPALTRPITAFYLDTDRLDASPNTGRVINAKPFAALIIVFDPTRPEWFQQQMELLLALVACVQPQQKQVVLVFSKCDAASSDDIAIAEERIAAAVAARGLLQLPIFFASARQGVGVDEPFRFLSSEMISSGHLPLLPPRVTFCQSATARRAAERKATLKVRDLLEKNVTDFGASWLEFLHSVETNSEDEEALLALMVLLGSERCFELFQVRLVHLKVRELQSEFRAKLMDSLAQHPSRPDTFAGKKIGWDDRDR